MRMKVGSRLSDSLCCARELVLGVWRAMSLGSCGKILDSSRQSVASRLPHLPYLVLAVSLFVPFSVKADTEALPQFVDLSLLVAPDLPGTWPAGLPPFQINHYERIGLLSAYNSEILTIDEHTATQMDAPAHGPVPAEMALVTSDKVPVWQFVGEACVIDCRHLLDKAPNGVSPLIGKELIIAWEKEHRPLGPGDVVLFYSGFTDKYYKPLPAGRRLVADPLQGIRPAWPDPDPECMEYLASRGVMTLATDSPSMGPIQDPLADETHGAGLKHGMTWTEGATGLGKLPSTGALYCMIGPKHADGQGTETRAFAIVGDPLAKRLIESARRKNVIDLSVLLSKDLPVWWPGRGVGNYRHPYYRNVIPPYSGNLHTLDSHTGTHLVPPAYALPTKGFDNRNYSPEVQQWLTDYEQRYGARGTSNVTTEKVMLSQTSGWARVIDVKHLIGTVNEKSWPASPEITVAEIQRYEEQHGELKPDDIVIFHSGYSDKYVKPLPEGEACMADPLNGKQEGWVAPGPDAIMYLANKGIRCVATDGPTLGGTEPKRALMTYWVLGSREMVGVEYLTNVASVPDEAYFLFAATKIRDCHGGPGRAIALY